MTLASLTGYCHWRWPSTFHQSTNPFTLKISTDTTARESSWVGLILGNLGWVMWTSCRLQKWGWCLRSLAMSSMLGRLCACGGPAMTTCHTSRVLSWYSAGTSPDEAGASRVSAAISRSDNFSKMLRGSATLNIWRRTSVEPSGRKDLSCRVDSQPVVSDCPMHLNHCSALAKQWK